MTTPDQFLIYESDNGAKPEDGPQTEDDGSPLVCSPDDESAGTATALVNLMLGFVGYHEGSNNDNRFSAALGRNYEAWCQDFDTWCALHLGYPHLDTGYTVEAVLDARDRGTFHPGIAGISKGDSVYFHWSTSSRPVSWPDHVGTFTGDFLADNGIKTVEGNHNDAVALVARRANILGYIRHPFDAGQGNPPAPKPDPDPVGILQVWFVTDVDDPHAHLMTNYATQPKAKGGLAMPTGQVVSAVMTVGGHKMLAWLAVGTYAQVRRLVLMGDSEAFKLPMRSRPVTKDTPGLSATLLAIKTGKL